MVGLGGIRYGAAGKEHSPKKCLLAAALPDNIRVYSVGNVVIAFLYAYDPCLPEYPLGVHLRRDEQLVGAPPGQGHCVVVYGKRPLGPEIFLYKCDEKPQYRGIVRSQPETVAKRELSGKP